jgi:transcriptional regulator with XRE-family HTH domain
MKADKSGIGSRLLQLRGYTGLSRATISEKSGVPVVTIRSWESGEIEIRVSNLERYLQAFASMGCHATIEWVLFGTGNAPYSRADNLRYLHMQQNEAMSLGNVVEMLTLTSNLFYYLDDQERVLYLNLNWCNFLGQSTQEISHDTTLQTLCSNEIYEACHENYLKSLSGEKVSFSYSLSNKFSKKAAEASMLYIPTVTKKGSKIVGVLGFLSASTIAQGDMGV